MLKIGFDIRVLNNKNITGIGRYTYNILNEILKISNDQIYYFGEPNETITNINKAIRFGLDFPISNNISANKLINCLVHLGDIKLDLIHSTYYPVYHQLPCKKILTIHDLIPLIMPEHSDLKTHKFFNEEIRRSAEACDHIITDSKSTKQDIIKLFSIDENKISVVYPGIDPIFKDQSLHDSEKKKVLIDRLGINNEYILTIATMDPRKNLKRIIDTFNMFKKRNKMEMSLVITGSPGWDYDKILKSIENSPYYKDIYVTNRLSDEEIGILYSNAIVFLFPSLYEGFGFPVLEAMACSAPVIASNNSSFFEIGQNSIKYCDPYDVYSILYSLEEIIFNPSLIKAMKENAKKRAEFFSFSKAALQICNIYKNL